MRPSHLGVCAGLLLTSSNSFAQTTGGRDPVTWGGVEDAGTERRSPALMITGYSLAGVGMAGVASGAYLMMVSGPVTYECVQAPCGGTTDQNGPLHGIGVITLLSGAGVAAIGLGLGIWGTIKVHGERRPDDDGASAAPSVYVGPSSVRARWAF